MESPCFFLWGRELTTIPNDAYCRLLGMELDEPGLALPEIWPVGLDDVRRAVEKAFEGEAAHLGSILYTVGDGGVAKRVWFDWCFSPWRETDGQVAGVLAVAVETTERVLAEGRQSFLLRLKDVLLDVTEPSEIASVVARILGEHLEVEQTDFGEVDVNQERGLIRGTWHRDHDSDLEEDEGEAILKELASDSLRDGIIVRVTGFPAGEDRAHGGEGVVAGAPGSDAIVMVPVRKEGRLVAVLSVRQASPRCWLDEEIMLIQETADRTAAAIDRRCTERILVQSEERSRDLMDAIPQLVWTTEPDGSVDYYNSRFEKFQGFRRLGDGSWDWPETLHPDDRERSVQAWRSAVEEERNYQVEQRILMADGSYRWFLSRAVPVRVGGRVIKWIGTATDIDETKKSEERIQESEERFRTLADGLPLIVWVYDAEGNREFVNQTFCDFFGLAREDIDGGQWHVPLHPDDAKAYEDEFNECVRNRRSFRSEVRVSDGEGGWRQFASWGRPRFSSTGKYLGIVGASADITERANAYAAVRKSERELRKLSATLELRVADRTAELQQQTDRLRNLAAELASAEHRERKRLAALLHDDLQQLLVAISMKIGEIGRHVVNDAGKLAITQASRWIGEAVEAARDLTRQLRPPTLYEDGLVPALRWLASEMKERHRLEIAIIAEVSVPSLSDDIKALLFECIRELLFNVTKYALVQKAEIRVREDANILRILVSDKGRGFEMNRISKDHQSEGFGLFSIRERLAALGGSLVIESIPGQGTDVELALPLGKRGIAENRSARPALSYAHHPLEDGSEKIATDHRTRVLVVDDHAVVRQGIANILDGDGRLLIVGEAADGVEAIEAVGARSPDVVLMDLNMPRMNGIEATREIRRRWPDVKVIGFSVQDYSATAGSMIDAGAAAFLSKAGDTEQMIASILSVAKSDGDGGNLPEGL